MGEEFREKFNNYSEGKLSDTEMKAFEQELEKLEEYQMVIDEYLENKEQDVTEPDKSLIRKQNKLLRRGKLRARLLNAITTIIIIFMAVFLCKFLTMRFYMSGTPKRTQVYQDVVNSLVAITQPNVIIRTNYANWGSFFTLNMKTEFSKTVGRESIKAGEMNIEFILNKAKLPDRRWTLNKGPNYSFLYPDPSKHNGYAQDWKKLEILGDGTVVEAFISLDKFYETDEVLQKFKDKEMQPLWFAVDTGADDKSQDGSNFIAYSVGFPSYPIWHNEDIVDEKIFRTDKAGKSVSSSVTYPNVDVYGDGKLRNKNFIDTLKLLKKYEGIANSVVMEPRLDLQRRLDYVDKNGVKIYGVVITGPSKEILKLKDEKWVANMRVGEVSFWNWN